MFPPLSDVLDLTDTLTGLKPNPTLTLTNTKLLELAKYHFPNGECLGASIYMSPVLQF